MPAALAVAESLEVLAAGDVADVRSLQEWHGPRSAHRT
jgi:hypothetical protein